MAGEEASQRQNLNAAATPGGTRRAGPPIVSYSNDQVQITFT
jgi:hypothetical protein